MIPWWWAAIGYVIGQIVAFLVMAICAANEPDNSKYIK